MPNVLTQFVQCEPKFKVVIFYTDVTSYYSIYKKISIFLVSYETNEEIQYVISSYQGRRVTIWEMRLKKQNIFYPD